MVGIATVIVLVIGAAIIGFRFAGTPSKVPDMQRSILAEFSGPRLAVGNFQSDQQNEGLAQGLKVDIQAELLRFDWLGVYVSSFGGGDEWTQTDVHYLLSGSIRTSASGSVFVLNLVEPKSGQILWVNSYDLGDSAERLVQIEQDASIRIATEIARPEGLLARLEERRVVRSTTLSDSAYGCIFELYRYWRTFTESDHLEVRTCLEQAVIDDPNYAEAQGALAFMYIDEDRKKYNVRVGYDPMARARKHALRAWELNPRSTIAGQALFTFYGRVKDFDNFLVIGQSAVENSPNNPDLLADFGNKLALNFKQLDLGAAYSLRAVELNRDPPGWYFITPTLIKYKTGQHADSLEYATKIQYVEDFYYYLVSIGTHHRQGNTADANALMAEFVEKKFATFEETRDRINEVFGGDLIGELLIEDFQATFAAYNSQ